MRTFAAPSSAGFMSELARRGLRVRFSATFRLPARLRPAAARKLHSFRSSLRPQRLCVEIFALGIRN